ncbi:hypothetical protein [Acinetobacter baumannii]|uniref:hypothetical protein n=1 Tax=Acinetobacter baumannii TaxID=470 RepID=UPI001F2CBD8D|nr:hypothetical protein [Acinetobacter baumannii]MDO7394644.1 hypothetical protein [Acinetobacter baumannii]UJX48836.1 hypothetical protein HUF98_03700 [Acinetobacter baumannii]
MIKALSLIIVCCSIVACASIPSDTSIQLLESDSTLVNGCKKLGPINTDTRGNPFNFAEKAESEFKRIAKNKYGADSAVVTYRSNLPAGRVVMQGTALKCY